MIKILADSSCDIPNELLEKYDISIVPLTIAAGSKNYIDKVEIDGPEFLKVITADRSLKLSTSQPSIATFIEAFEKYSDFDEIILVTMSKNGSGTYNAARLAITDFEEKHVSPRIFLVDSLSASIGVGRFALKAAELREAGLSAEQIASDLLDESLHFGSYFYADTLEYLRKGGRVNTVSAAVGTLLGMKVIVGIEGGFGRSAAKCRGEKAGIEQLAKFFLERHGENKIYITHSGNEEGVAYLLNLIRQGGVEPEVVQNDTGCVLCVHAGPRAIGAFFLQDPRFPSTEKAVADEIRAFAEKAARIAREKYEEAAKIAAAKAGEGAKFAKEKAGEIKKIALEKAEELKNKYDKK